MKRLLIKKNIKENENIILASEDLDWCYYFARTIPGSNIKALEEVIIKSKNVHRCFYFAKNVPGANKQLLSQVVLESLDEFYIKMFYTQIDFDKTEYDKYLLFM